MNTIQRLAKGQEVHREKECAGGLKLSAGMIWTAAFLPADVFVPVVSDVEVGQRQELIVLTLPGEGRAVFSAKNLLPGPVVRIGEELQAGSSGSRWHHWWYLRC